MTRELKIRELQLEQKAIQLKAEEALLELDVEYQERRKEIEEGFQKELKLFNAKVEVELAEFPEPEATEPEVSEEEPTDESVA